MQIQVFQKNELPKGWEVKTLDEVSVIKQYGYTCPASNTPKGPRLLRITDMDNDGGFIQEPTVYSNLSLIEAKKYLLEEGDILIARTGEPGKASMFNSKEPAIFASYLIRFRINPKIVSPKLVLYFLRTRSYFDQIIEKTSETTQKNVNATKLGQTEIPIPPFPTQQKIVSKLDEFFSHYKKLLEEKQKAKKNYDKILQSAITSLIPVKDLPYGWRLMELKDIANVGQGGTPKRSKKEYWNNGTIPWLRSGEIRNNIIIDSKEKITELGLKESSATLCPEGTIMLAMTGQGLTRGRTALLSKKASANQSCAHIIVKRDIVNEKFLWYYLIGQYWIIRSIDKGTNQPGINTTIIKGFEIPVPPMNVQTEIIKKIEKIKNSIDTYRVEERNTSNFIEQLPKSVLSTAFRGELVG